MIVIIDDEYEFALILKKELEKSYKDTDIYILTNFDENFLNNNDVEILFVDIELGNGKNGIDLASMYRRQGNDDVEIIFISMHETHEHSSHVAFPLYFIRKTHLKADLITCRLLLEERRRKREMHIMLDNHLIKLTDVLYIESQGNKVNYMGPNNSIILERRMKLADVETELEKFHFIKCHKSYVVNAAYVTKIRASYVIVNCVKIPVSRSEHKHFMDMYHNYYIEKKRLKLR